MTRRLVYQAGFGIWQPRVAPREPGMADAPVSVLLEVENSEAKGLGRPLPGGTVRVLAPDAGGALRLAGEDVIAHTPRDETARVRLGSAFDVVATRRRVEWTRIDDRTNETVRVIESVPGDWRLVRSSLPGQKVDATTLRFEVPVPAGGESTLTYRVRSRW